MRKYEALIYNFGRIDVEAERFTGPSRDWWQRIEAADPKEALEKAQAIVRSGPYGLGGIWDITDGVPGKLIWIPETGFEN